MSPRRKWSEFSLSIERQPRSVALIQSGYVSSLLATLTLFFVRAGFAHLNWDSLFANPKYSTLASRRGSKMSHDQRSQKVRSVFSLTLLMAIMVVQSFPITAAVRQEKQTGMDQATETVVPDGTEFTV